MQIKEIKLLLWSLTTTLVVGSAVVLSSLIGYFAHLLFQAICKPVGERVVR